MPYSLTDLRAMLQTLRERQGREGHAEWIELATEKFYRAVLVEGDSAVDVGAHRARHTIPMARSVGASGRIYAIEAAPATLPKLHAAISRAEPKHIRQSIVVYPFAAGDVPGLAEFVYVPKAAGLSGLKTNDRQDVVRDEDLVREQVEVKRIDDLIPDDPRVRFVKLDVEGAELPALRGAPNLLARCRPCLAFENGSTRYQRRFNYTAEDFFAFFDSAGYTMYTPFCSVFDRQWMDGTQPGQLFAIPRELPELVAGALAPALIDAMQQVLFKKSVE